MAIMVILLLSLSNLYGGKALWIPPFKELTPQKLLASLKVELQKQRELVQDLIKDPQPPTFENFLLPLETSTIEIANLNNYLAILTSSHTSKEFQEVAKVFKPMFTKQEDEIRLNSHLFKKLEKLYKQKDQLKLNPEQKTLLEKYYKEAYKGGAGLNQKQKDRLLAINEKLTLLDLKFGENVLAENNRFELLIKDKKDLGGLPADVIEVAAQEAKTRGYPQNTWVFTLHSPSRIPFLQYSDNRKLREKIYLAYINRGNHNDAHDNKKILTAMANLRLEKAKLLGYLSHSHYTLEENMAQTPDKVRSFLKKLWKPALKVAKKEADSFRKMIAKGNQKHPLKPWDWFYYAEKVRKEKYNLDDNALRPYFSLNNVKKGVFKVVKILFGITLHPRPDIPKYHPDSEVYEVKDLKGSHIGIIYLDYFPRSTKEGGAFMRAFRKQHKLKGKMVTPVIVNVGNFTKPIGDKPALLSLDETLTLFHEFGHALHGLLSDCQFYTLSGTDVALDFVELPSQIMENWALHPKVLSMYAKHYKTGEIIPQSLVGKLVKSKNFGVGFAMVEYLAASFLDLDWHTIQKPVQDAAQFEKRSMERIGLIPEIYPRYRSTYFAHIFNGEYSSGYYSYIWAEILDADAFELFKEKGIFDPGTGQAFKTHILSSGGSEKPMVLYKRFRGSEPSIKPLLKRRNLLVP